MKYRITIEKQPERHLQHGEKEVTETIELDVLKFYVTDILPIKLDGGVKKVEIEALEE